MPTEQSTQGSDAQEAHQTQQEGQNATAHSEQSTFDARKAFDATNRRVNEISSKMEKFDPEIIAQIADKLGVSKKEAEKKVAENPDVNALVNDAVWQKMNEDRISDANADGAYDNYLKQGLRPELALRLAEQDNGIVVDNSAQKRQKKVSAADTSIDRDVAPEVTADEAAYGITAEDKKKYGDRAKNVVVVR